MGKKIAVSIAILIIVVSAIILYRRHEAKLARLRLEQEAAEMVWREFVTGYQHEVPLGTTRSEVKKYLDGKQVRYSDGREIMVKLGETPDDGLVCDYWNVYASFAFEKSGTEAPSPLDKLTGITLQRIGHCL